MKAKLNSSWVLEILAAIMAGGACGVEYVASIELGMKTVAENTIYHSFQL